MKALKKIIFIIVLFAYSAKVYSNSIIFRLGINSAKPEMAQNNIFSPTKHSNTVYSINAELAGVIIKNFELGSYIAYSNMNHYIPLQQNSSGNYVLVDNNGIERYSTANETHYITGSTTLFYGFAIRYHLIELLTGISNLRFDLYGVSKIGLVSASFTDFDGNNFVSTWNKPFTEFSAGLGTGYSFTRHFGCFFEYSIGRLYHNGRTKFNAGFVYRF
jgi:hypothetical protein